MESYETNSDATDMAPIKAHESYCASAIEHDGPCPPSVSAQKDSQAENLLVAQAARIAELELELVTTKAALALSEAVPIVEQAAKNPEVVKQLAEQNKKLDIRVGQSHYRNPA